MPPEQNNETPRQAPPGVTSSDINGILQELRSVSNRVNLITDLIKSSPDSIMDTLSGIPKRNRHGDRARSKLVNEIFESRQFKALDWRTKYFINDIRDFFDGRNKSKFSKEILQSAKQAERFSNLFLKTFRDEFRSISDIDMLLGERGILGELRNIGISVGSIGKGTVIEVGHLISTYIPKILGDGLTTVLDKIGFQTEYIRQLNDEKNSRLVSLNEEHRLELQNIRDEFNRRFESGDIQKEIKRRDSLLKWIESSKLKRLELIDQRDFARDVGESAVRIQRIQKQIDFLDAKQGRVHASIESYSNQIEEERHVYLSKNKELIDSTISGMELRQEQERKELAKTLKNSQSLFAKNLGAMFYTTGQVIKANIASIGIKLSKQLGDLEYFGRYMDQWGKVLGTTVSLLRFGIQVPLIILKKSIETGFKFIKDGFGKLTKMLGFSGFIDFLLSPQGVIAGIIFYNWFKHRIWPMFEPLSNAILQIQDIIFGFYEKMGWADRKVIDKYYETKLQKYLDENKGVAKQLQHSYRSEVAKQLESTAKIIKDHTELEYSKLRENIEERMAHNKLLMHDKAYFESFGKAETLKKDLDKFDGMIRYNLTQIQKYQDEIATLSQYNPLRGLKQRKISGLSGENTMLLTRSDLVKKELLVLQNDLDQRIKTMQSSEEIKILSSTAMTNVKTMISNHNKSIQNEIDSLSKITPLQILKKLVGYTSEMGHSGTFKQRMNVIESLVTTDKLTLPSDVLSERLRTDISQLSKLVVGTDLKSAERNKREWDIMNIKLDSISGNLDKTVSGAHTALIKEKLEKISNDINTLITKHGTTTQNNTVFSVHGSNDARTPLLPHEKFKE